ncbi:bifunctional 3-(3-hydroxy-phenyl)propionate/3-hydroxycinnamic acid hydroxylase [Rhizobium leguminosarum]|uniref:bifunctional 3-(3-hydroxy-phenyl)propionate/3-hydroxycinnamic acid hydroxylase n=1 Tax=Rhizobium leguminosarum TaxID=384 RepID=UPI00067ED161|nr:bifunctional 3-(3-hydroxy-phenyl)propionate/3-hydroxycinnamic acid hydroxylase [Rhizobium leguminosarum]
MDTIDFKQLDKSSFDVVIVGLGPVGITLCNLLGRLGVSVLGIDARDDIFALPRAIGMDHEVMRVFQGIGVAGDLSSVVGEYRDSEYRAADGTLLRKFISPQSPHPLGWPAYLTFVQPALERVLREKAVTLSTVALLTGVELAALDNAAEPTLSLRQLPTGDTVSLTTRFVVGCDGGTSFVRGTLGIGFEDLIFDQPWVVVDVIIGDEPLNLPETNVQFCHPARPHTFVVLPGNLRRWEFMMLPGETAEEINQPDQIWGLLAPWIKPGQAEIWRSATYRFHALVAESWRIGNVFLAGDACHMTPPFLAQGMVQGIKDASNLAWKIAHVLKGGPPKILDTYEQERRPLVHKVISITKGLGEVICEIDEGRAKTRDDTMKALMEEGKGILVRQSLFPPISAGFIGFSDNALPMAGAGEPCPQPRVLVDGKLVLLDDVLGDGFALLTRDIALSATVREFASALDVAVFNFEGHYGLNEDNDVLKDWLAERGAHAVLVRPDRVAFAAVSDERELVFVLEQLAAWLEVPTLANPEARKAC